MSDLSIIDTDDEPTDWHGRTSDDFDTDCGDYEDSQQTMRARFVSAVSSEPPRTSACSPNFTHGAAYRDELVSRYLRK